MSVHSAVSHAQHLATFLIVYLQRSRQSSVLLCKWHPPGIVDSSWMYENLRKSLRFMCLQTSNGILVFCTEARCARAFTHVRTRALHQNSKSEPCEKFEVDTKNTDPPPPTTSVGTLKPFMKLTQSPWAFTDKLNTPNLSPARESAPHCNIETRARSVHLPFAWGGTQPYTI